MSERLRPTTLGLGGIAVALVSCAERPSSHACEESSEQQAIVSGSPSADYLALGEPERQNVGLIRSRDGNDSGDFCTAVLIPGKLALSARHCAPLVRPEIVLPDGVHLDIIDSFEHPNLDVTAHLTRATCGGSVPVGLPLTDPSWAPRLGSRLTLAGYGITGTGATKELNFAVELLVETTEETLIVDGAGRSGACAGDSGGPLLVREPSRGGAVLVAGTLSRGSADCIGRDEYVRTAALTAWLDDLAVTSPTTLRPCGEIDARGRCFEGGAIWCAEESLTGRSCATGERCGWSSEEDGYRCVAGDACPSDHFGVCQGEAATFCTDGTAFVEACSGRCGYDPTTGRAQCLPRQAE